MMEKERSVKMPERDLVEWVSDQLLLLYAINHASEIRHLGVTRIQKIMFLSELASWEKKIGGLDYQFIRYHFGPFSSELGEDIDRFCKRKLIESWHSDSSDINAYRLLPEGRELFEDSHTILARNKQILIPIMEKIQYTMKAPKIDLLLPEIYCLSNPLNNRQTIEETELTGHLLTRKKRPSNMKPFDITEEEAESFEIMLDPKLWKDFLLAEKSVRTQPAKPWRENPLYSG